LRVAEQLGQTVAARALRGNLPWALFRTGDWDEALGLANELLESAGPSFQEVAWRAVRVRIYAARGATERALAEVPELLRAGRESGQHEEFLAEAAQVFLDAGRPAEAKAICDELRELARERPQLLISPTVALPLTELGYAEDVHAGLLHVPETRWRQLAARIADGRYEEVADACVELGETSMAAELRLRAGARLHREGRIAEAVEPLERALAFYESVGATRYVEEARQLLADAGAAAQGRVEESG
jgi:tetratricopeptide (TPR) repeat protein